MKTVYSLRIKSHFESDEITKRVKDSVFVGHNGGARFARSYEYRISNISSLSEATETMEALLKPLNSITSIELLIDDIF